MPFGLKNAGATYQKLMDRVRAPMIGKNVQTYVDDMVVTSQVKDQHVTDLEELFTTIAKYNLKLNPEKCVFWVEAGKFLGFLLIECGIEANMCYNHSHVQPNLSEGGAAVNRAEKGEIRGIPISSASREIVGSSGPRSVKNPSST